MEKLDILDESGMKTGIQESRDIVHLKGLLHSEVTAFIYTESGKILVQKRSNNKKMYNNCWSTTGGHVLAGETNEQALIREINEELGVNVSNSDIKYVLTYKSSKTKGKVINNKFMNIYLVKISDNIDKFNIQNEELSDVKYISIEELEEIVNTRNENYKFPQKTEQVVKEIKQILKK